MKQSFVPGQQHVARMHVAVKGADAKHVEAVDVKQFEEPVVAQLAGFQQFIEAAAGNELGNHHVLVAQRLMHARERQAGEIERVAVLFVDGAQGVLAGDLVAQIEFAQRVFLDVTEDAHGITDLAEFGIKKGGQTKQALEAGNVGDELRAHIPLDGLDDHRPRRP